MIVVEDVLEKQSVDDSAVFITQIGKTNPAGKRTELCYLNY